VTAVLVDYTFKMCF